MMPDTTAARLAFRHRTSPCGRTAIAGGVLTVCLVVMGSTLMLWRARQTKIEEWKSNLSNLSPVLAASTNQSMKAADLPIALQG